MSDETVGAQVVAVVLAAGDSTRLGQPKQLIPLAGRPALAYTLDALRQSTVDRIVVVLGHASDAIKQAIDLVGVTVVQNDDYAQGQSTSVLAGIKSLGEEVGAALMVVGDQPLLSPAVVDTLIAAYRRTGGPFIVPLYAGEWGNPVLLARGTWQYLEGLKGDTGARPILRKNMDMVLEVPVPGPMPDDIDTPEDYERVRRRIEGGT
jgi:molybdenum cofactor cytidylyltransferase